MLSGKDAQSAKAWTFSNGSEFPGASGAIEADAEGVLHLRFDFTKGGAYVAAYRAVEPAASLKSVAFRVRKPASASLTVRVTDETGQTFQKSFTYDHADWQQAEFDMAGWGHHYGGADDGVLHQPVKQIGILVENEGLVNPSGEVLIADVVAQKGTGGGAPALESGPYVGDYRVTDFGDAAGFGVSGSARLERGAWSIDFSQGDSASLTNSISLLGKPQELKLVLEGGRPGNVLKIDLGSHFQTFSRTIGQLTGKKQEFTFPAPPEGWQFSGGENSSTVQYPVRLSALILERGSAPAEPTEVRLAELRCTTQVRRERAVTMLARLTPGAVEGDARAFTLECTARNLFDGPLDGTLKLTVSDWDRNAVHEESRPWTLPAKAEPAEQSFTFPAPASLKFVEARPEFTAAGQSPAYAAPTFTQPVEIGGDAELRPESPWGMGVYLYRYAASPNGYAAMDHAAALAQTAGVKWTREEFSWAATEPEQGKYAFEFYDNVVETAHRHGISVYGLLSYWSNWTQPYTEKGIDDFCAWARAVVRRFKDRVKHWEVYNEPNIFFWQGPKELYPVLLERCYAAIKQEDPTAQVLGCSTAGIDARFIQKCLDAGAPFDILTIHPYRGRLIEDQFIQQLRDTARQVGGRPVWITEMGWSTQIGGTDERAQAELLARCYLSAVASGVCQNVSWYDFRNDGSDPYYNEANFGVLHNDFTPKPAYRGLVTVCRTLGQGQPRTREDFGAQIRALEMGDALALWTMDEAVELECRVARGEPRVLNLMGDQLSPARDGNTLTLNLKSNAPLFVMDAALEAVEPAHASERLPGVVRF